MPKNEVTDPITDQEMAFALLVLSGGMTDRQAAEAVGLNPDSAADTKDKPHVRAYMLERRAAVQQQLVQQEADLSRPSRLSRHAAEHAAERTVEGLHRPNLDREQVLARLWEIAYLSPEMTRGSITGQVKALSMIVAMQNFIPNPRALARLSVSSENKSAPTPTRQEDSHARPGSAAQAPPSPGSSQATVANRVAPSEAPRLPYVPLFNSVPDLGVPLPIKNPFVHSR